MSVTPQARRLDFGDVEQVVVPFADPQGARWTPQSVADRKVRDACGCSSLGNRRCAIEGVQECLQLAPFGGRQT